MEVRNQLPSWKNRRERPETPLNMLRAAKSPASTTTSRPIDRSGLVSREGETTVTTEGAFEKKINQGGTLL